MADQLIESMQDAWRNEKHRAQWTMTLRDYAKPLRSRPVNGITTEDVLAVLQPIWRTKPETASRLRGRIERVLDAAKARGYRSGENPAMWRGHLQRLLPPRQKLTRGHHAAMPYEDVPALVSVLRERMDISSRALEFTILTAARSGEVFGATWGEVDLKTKIWAVPAKRMKGGREHRVPLVDRAVELLEELKPLDGEVDPRDLIFPGRKAGRPLSNMALNMLLRRLGHGDCTVHGFRSSFRDWAGECTEFPREIAEAALAHIVGDETERAYRRGDALEKRRRLMEVWAEFLNNGKAMSNIVAISRKADHAVA
jgi:integrase